MTSRLDRLLLLLDTGSSTSVRTTAAKQLAQLAVKSVISDVAIVEDDIKTTRQHASTMSDSAAWSELMSVVARILPYLHSKSHESRTAVSVALSQIFTLVPLWQPGVEEGAKTPGEAQNLPPPEFPLFSVQELMEKGTLLLASSGKEFTKPTGILASSLEVKKARKEAMGRLGLDFLDSVGGADDIDLEKELAADEDEMNVDSETAPVKTEDDVKADEDVKMDDDDHCNGRPEPLKLEISVAGPSHSPTPAASSPVPSNGASAAVEDMSALSARERNRLKRKRKGGNSAFVVATAAPAASKYTAAVTAPPNKVRLVASEDRNSSSSRAASPKSPTEVNEKVTIDPSKGGAVSPKAEKQSKALEVEPGRWVWDGLVKMLEVDLFSHAWEVRHGAAMALRELLKSQGKYGGMRANITWEENEIAHEKWCNDLAVKFLCVFVLDRFGDFVSDQVVAPVRETVSQTLASLMLHMPRRSALRVHSILLEMIRQDFPVTTKPANSSQKGKATEKGHVWEVRHAGLLGIKYEVAVRSDLVTAYADEAAAVAGQEVLRGVVDAAVLGLGDRDDDVRSVAASCLLPVAEHLVNQLPHELSRVLAVLWSCLSDMKDDLSSSVGTVMELLGKLVAYDKVIGIIADPSQSQPLSVLAPTLFPFFRHTIPNVRLAVVKTLHSFMSVPSLPRDWLSVPFLQLLFQNMIVEERSDIRDATIAAWRLVLDILSATEGWLQSTVSQPLLLQWYEAMMTPLGTPINVASFYDPALAKLGADHGAERHNVDKNMIAQDMSLIPTETIIAARVAAAISVAYFMAVWPSLDESHEAMFRPILVHYIDSPSMLQKFLAAIVTEEWAREHDARSTDATPLLDKSALAKDLSVKTLEFLQNDPPPAYHEMMYTLARLHAECFNLLQAFSHDCKLPISRIPSLGTEIDITGTRADCFTISTAQSAVGDMFDKLKDSLGRTKKKELAILKEKRTHVAANIDRYIEVKAQYDVRVSAAFAAAFVALKATPDKVSPIVKGVMNGIKSEENIQLQTRSAIAVAAFVEFCVQRQLAQPPEKIVKNLCTFLCQDIEQTPTFAFSRKYQRGILSFQKPPTPKDANGKEDPVSPEASSKARLSRRGASLAFVQLSAKFGDKLLDIVPNMWQSMAGGLLSACAGGTPAKMDSVIDQRFGQDVIDSLSVLDAIIPTFHPGLYSKFHELFPLIHLALRSKFAIIRQCAARCFATVCDVILVAAMRYVIEKVIPYLGDALNLANRQGATELAYHIVQKLDIKALPYVIFMIVPVLGRMSDSDDDIRSTATNTFASLVKMVPLEAGLPDPPDFSEDLLRKREEERQFLTQLLDGSKVQQYEIPVKINAELRKYQQEGVNWLAFLAKYQLHGILCDDMGLGKTLQSICILASKHHERAKRYEETKSPDSTHLPSLIVCPPTLTGHWYYEILKYADNLKPIMYTGNSRERCKLIPKLKKHDVVITSYEVVRNDVASLQDMSWHYCILDEGHIIKNAKTKLTKAVKSIRANHRLILSGTPIQNNVLELWSLFDFLMPGFLGTESSFSERFSKPILSNRDGKGKNGEAAALALEALHKQVLPFLLRRLKEDVLHDLPPKIIQDYYCELSELQKYMYDDFSKSNARASAEDVVRAPEAGSSGSGKGQQHVFQSLQYLRKLCNHPALVLKNDAQAIKDTFENAGYKGSSTNLSDIHHAPKLLALRQLLSDCGIGSGSALTGESAKSELLDSDAGSAGGAFSQHRVLIFCQMKQMIDIIETDLFKQHMPSVTYMRLDGSTDANKRHAIVQTFNSDPSIDCLLLTTHVGGLGLTLTGADTVIFVEHDWNPMKDLQAMDRAHRIGQKKVVNVYRLITKGTLEEKIMGLQRFKLNIANSVVTQQNSGLASMDTDLVLDLFRHTTEEDDAAAAAKKKEKEASAVGQKNVLKGLEDLPPEEEYQGLDLASFMGSLSAR